MNYLSWKNSNRFTTSTVSEMQLLQDRIQATIVKHHRNLRSCVVEGVCMTDTGCENTYRKTLAGIAKGSGPFCDKCIHKALFIDKPVDPNKKLLKDERPDIYASIVSCYDDFPMEKLTCGSERKVRFRCENKCDRCQMHHEWDAVIYNRVGRDSGCPTCSGHQYCPCQKEDEFKCSVCKKIYNKQDACYGHVCKICNSRNTDGNVKRFIATLWSRTSLVMNRNPRKHGDLTLEYIHERYTQQEGRCHITGIKMNIGAHMDWKMSIERVNESKPYNKNNIVLIITEMQSGHRQWTREIFDNICSIVLGREMNEETEEEVKETIRKELYVNYERKKIGSKKDKPSVSSACNENGQRQCSSCANWQDPIQYGKKTNVCRECRRVYSRNRESTPQGRVRKLYGSSKSNGVQRDLEHTISIDDIKEQLISQAGRCFYSGVPLTFDGQYQMSLERIDPRKGYIKENIAIILLALNVGDWTRLKHPADDKEGSSGWTKEKLEWVVQNRPRDVVPVKSSVLEIWKPFEQKRNEST